MPRLQDIEIVRAWRHRDEGGRIHYVVLTHTGDERRLYADEGSGLGKVLNAALDAQGYTGPSDHE